MLKPLTKRFKITLIATTILLLAIPTIILAASWDSISKNTRENEVGKSTCGSRTVGYFYAEIADAYGHNPSKDSMANCVYSYHVKYKALKPGFNKSLGKDLFCKGVKVGSVLPSVNVQQGTTGPLTADGNSYIPDGCGFQMTIN